MTQFENLELIYNQFFNLADEVKCLIDREEFDAAIERIQYKDKLIKKLIATKKTVNFTPVDEEKIYAIEKKLQAKEQENILLLQQLQDELSKKLKNNKQNVKVHSAYSMNKDKQHGFLVDLSE